MRMMLSAAIAAGFFIVASPAAAAVPVVCSDTDPSFDCYGIPSGNYTYGTTGFDVFIKRPSDLSALVGFDFNATGLLIHSSSTITTITGTYTFTPSAGAFTSVSLLSNTISGFSSDNFSLTPEGSLVINFTGVNLLTRGEAQLSFAAPAAVPEPAAWGMMLLGFGGIGFAMRRKHQTRTAQVA